jgi:hypothetical protein
MPVLLRRPPPRLAPLGRGRVVIPDTLPLRGDWYEQGAPDGGRPSDLFARWAHGAIRSGPLARKHARLSEAIPGRSSSVRDVSSWYRGEVLVLNSEEAYN